MTKVGTLTYFSSRGLAEIIRIVLVYSKVEYEEINVGVYNRENQPEAFKKLIESGKLPFEQLPIWEEEDGFLLTQSGAILRYLAKKFGLYGKNEKEAATVDMLVSAADDAVSILKPVFDEKDRKKKDLIKKKIFEEGKLFKWFGFFEKILKNSKTKYFASDERTLFDLKLWQVFEGIGVEILPEEHFPLCLKYVTELLNIKHLKEYSQSEKRFPIQNEW
jgi:glutathione S-transferase